MLSIVSRVTVDHAVKVPLEKSSAKMAVVPVMTVMESETGLSVLAFPAASVATIV